MRPWATAAKGPHHIQLVLLTHPLPTDDIIRFQARPHSPLNRNVKQYQGNPCLQRFRFG